MTEMQSVDDLQNAVQGIVVKDYGDFKRKTVTYLNRFQQNNQLKEDQEKQLAFMKYYIQYHPNLELNDTKLWTLTQIEKLRS